MRPVVFMTVILVGQAEVAQFLLFPVHESEEEIYLAGLCGESHTGKRATDYLETEKHFRRIMGYRSLWMLDSALGKDGQVAKADEREYTLPPEGAETASCAPERLHNAAS